MPFRRNWFGWGFGCGGGWGRGRSFARGWRRGLFSWSNHYAQPGYSMPYGYHYRGYRFGYPSHGYGTAQPYGYSPW